MKSWMFDANTFFGTMKMNNTGEIFECHTGIGGGKGIYVVTPGSDKILMWCTRELWDKIYDICGID